MSNRNTNSFVLAWGVCAVGLVSSLLPTAEANSLSETDNAALLYYQAFLLCPAPQNIPSEASTVVFRGIGSVERLRKYVLKRAHRQEIQLAEAASRVPYCNWAIPYPQGPDVRSELAVHTRFLAFLVGADARVLAADGEYATGFSRCLLLRRFGGHIADDPGMAPELSVSVDSIALLCMRRILDIMPPDPETLKSLRDELRAQRTLPTPSATQFKRDFDRIMWRIGKDGRVFPSLREKLAEKASSEKQRKAALKLSNAELLELMRQPYAEFLDSVLEAMAGDMSYAHTYRNIERLAGEFTKKSKEDPAIIRRMQDEAENLAFRYDLYVTNTSQIHAVEAAVEIYLLKAITGSLPESLCRTAYQRIPSVAKTSSIR